jgi:hypothetical protein
MQIECILKRDGGTKADIDGIEYHFAPQPDGAHAEVEREKHIHRFLEIIPQAYRQYGASLPAAAPVEQVVVVTKTYTDGTTFTGPAPLPDHSPAQQNSAKLGDEVLYGSNVHPASFEINGKTYALGDVVALAHAATGLSADAWSALADEDRAEHIDDALDKLAADTNGDGTVDSAEERAALVAQYKARFNKSPGNMGVAKLRAALAAE